MAIFEVQADGFREISKVTFAEAVLQERRDLQRMLLRQIEIVSPDTLVIAEEFSEWSDSNRRIDLLGVDRSGNLVVIELKRTEDGGHMELQALRYAAMVSAMGFDRAVAVYQDFLVRTGQPGDAKEKLLEFLDWDSPESSEFPTDVRIVLVSAEFSKELTTAVIWLNTFDLSIECVRVRPYRDGERILVDVQKLIPLPEAEDYRVQLREKEQRERAARKSKQDRTRYDVTTTGEEHRSLAKRHAIYVVVRCLISRGVTPEAIAENIPWRRSTLFRSAAGALDSMMFVDAVTAEAERDGRVFDETRFFCADEELLRSGGRTYAFSNQWGDRTLEAIDRLSNAYPDAQIRYKACIED